MITVDLSRTALALSPEERLELARRLVENVMTPEEVLEEGVARIEDVAADRVQSLTEAQYRAAVKFRWKSFQVSPGRCSALPDNANSSRLR